MFAPIPVLRRRCFLACPGRASLKRVYARLRRAMASEEPGSRGDRSRISRICPGSRLAPSARPGHIRLLTQQGLRALRAGGFAAFTRLALDDARRLAAAAAQIIELGAADLAAAHDLDRVDHRRIEREHALDALAIGDLANREVLVEARARAADADALVSLDAALLALDHLDVDEHGVARLEVGDVLAGGKLRYLLLFELLDQVHGKSPSAAPIL